MGVDIYGKGAENKASHNEGENYFRSNWWFWRPILTQMEPFVKGQRMIQGALPDIDCKYCAGTGTRFDMEVANGCNSCSGTGSVRPREADYPHDWEFTQEWIAFLRGCGGFEIC